MANSAVSGGVARSSTPFLITLDPDEKRRWKSAADAAGISMAEYVRRAVQAAADAPTAEEIAAARRLASEINASVERMEVMLDRTLARIASVLDPEVEAARRDRILAELDQSGIRLDLEALAISGRG
jgi:hypothetical protein